MAYTQEQLDQLDAEIAAVRLVQSTSISDRSTTFRPLSELLQLRALMIGGLSTSVSRTRYGATRKGT